MHELSEADRAFRDAVERCEISPAAFDHRAHLRLAYAYLAEHGIDEAADATRSTLLNLLRHYGVDTSKFHETLTRAWLLAVRHFMVKAGDTACADDFIERSAILLDSSVMLSHYTRERLFSEDARQAFVEPDLEPIPRHQQDGRPAGG